MEYAQKMVLRQRGMPSYRIETHSKTEIRTDFIEALRVLYELTNVGSNFGRIIDGNGTEVFDTALRLDLQILFQMEIFGLENIELEEQRDSQ